MSDLWDGKERRKHPRVDLTDVDGKLHTLADAPIMDVSSVGALLELTCALPRGARYSLKFEMDSGSSLEIIGEVQRSYVHGFDKRDKGGINVRYRAAIEFVDLTAEQKKLLDQLVEEKKDIRSGAELTN